MKADKLQYRVRRNLKFKGRMYVPGEMFDVDSANGLQLKKLDRAGKIRKVRSSADLPAPAVESKPAKNVEAAPVVEPEVEAVAEDIEETPVEKPKRRRFGKK